MAERLAEGRAAANAHQQVGDDRLDALGGRQLLEDRQRAVERQTRLEERGELLRERQEVALADARGAAEGEPRPALGVGRDPDREVGVALEPLDDGAGVGRLHHTVDRLAAPVGGPVDEDGHRDYASSCVTRSTSSTVVTPAHALAQPSSRSVTMPGLERRPADVARRRAPEDEASRVLADGEELVDARPAAVAGAATFVAAAAAIEARAVGAGDAERVEVGRRRRVGHAARRADAPDEPLGEDALEHRGDAGRARRPCRADG